MLRWRNLAIGLHFFTVGFAKKLAADPMGRIIEPVWAAPAQARWPAHCYSRCWDFTRSSIWISRATPTWGAESRRMLGFRLPLNFRAPFFAHNPVGVLSALACIAVELDPDVRL